MDATKIAELKLFVEQCKSNPTILYNPSLGFFKSYLESMGARIPLVPKSGGSGEDDVKSEEEVDTKNPNLSSYDKVDEDIVESDVELDNTDVVEPDNEPPQKMGDPSIEVTEQNMDAAQISKSKAVDAISEGMSSVLLGKPERSYRSTNRSYFVESAFRNIICNQSVFVKLEKPNAAIRDADAALQINPDSAKGHKIRGMARAMLGLWEEAARDLRIASTLDYDEEIGLVLKKVEPNARRIEEHHRKYERLQKERELKKMERERQRQADSQATYKRDKKREYPTEKKASDPEAASALKDGQVIGIHSARELDNKLSAASATSRLSILYFTATWCGPCRFISPLFTSLAEKYPKVVFLKVDIDEAKDAAAQWNINSVPTFFFVKNGKEVDKVVGADKSSLEKKIAKYAAQP
ncbi:hypothetical protein LguiA_027838 [Lonicera macranthoides]